MGNMIFSPMQFPLFSSQKQLSSAPWPCRIPPHGRSFLSCVYQLIDTEVKSPIILSSAHSGCYYPDRFVDMSQQSLYGLRLNEDSFVDVLATKASQLGAPLLSALFPRSFCDVNRASWELDPKMFTGDIPAFVKPTERALAGFGSVPRCVGDNRLIYDGKIPFMEAAKRIRFCWMPFHGALLRLIKRARHEHGFCIMLDLHSMPDIEGENTPDFVVGTRFGRSCSHLFCEIVEDTLQRENYYVVRNYPYAGGYITQHYGRPSENIHVIQLEIRRTLYMNTKTYQLRRHSARVVERLLAKIVQNIMGFLKGYSLRAPLER